MRTNRKGWIAAGVLGLTAAAAVYTRKRQTADCFAGKVVVITGGSRGLGLEMARLWAAEGARVAICARTVEDLERAVDEVSADGVLAVAYDITQREDCRAFIDEVLARWGRVDVLVNNAGIIQAGPLECMTLRDFETAMATHFWGPLYLVSAAYPAMRAQGGGRVVNIASIGGEISVPQMLPYCASKFALVGLSEGLHSELRAADIAVTTVCPGLMRTGSPRNAQFKGRHRAEYAWFSISGSLPGLSIDSRRAARQIIEACRHRQAYLRISLPAKMTVPLRAAAPGLTAAVFSWVQQWLPRPGTPSTKSHPGSESHSAWSPSLLTRLTERAAVRNNEVR